MTSGSPPDVSERGEVSQQEGTTRKLDAMSVGKTKNYYSHPPSLPMIHRTLHRWLDHHYTFIAVPHVPLWPTAVPCFLKSCELRLRVHTHSLCLHGTQNLAQGTRALTLCGSHYTVESQSSGDWSQPQTCGYRGTHFHYVYDGERDSYKQIKKTTKSESIRPPPRRTWDTVNLKFKRRRRSQGGGSN